MATLEVLRDFELVPVVELEPLAFQAPSRGGTRDDRDCEAWHRYWVDSLADSGLTGLAPLHHGSRHVPTSALAAPSTLQRLLTLLLHRWGGFAAIENPQAPPVLDGGLALRSRDDVLIQPTCSSDLASVSCWRAATAYTGADWKKLWIGHPWISVKYEAPWLLVSEPHEFSPPTARWALDRDCLIRALRRAEDELAHFARRLAFALSTLGYHGDALLVGRQLAAASV